MNAKGFTKVLGAAVLAAGLSIAGSANAVVILDPTTLAGPSATGTTGDLSWSLFSCTSCSPSGVDTYEVNQSPGTANPNAADVLAITGDTVTELYKNDVGSGDSGPFSASYNTVYSPPTDPSGATISYVSGVMIADPKWLVVKDGNAVPESYIIDISGWDGFENIVLRNFWPAQGSISHVAVFGGTSTKVSEPAPLAVLGFGMLALGYLRRRKSIAA